MHFELPEKLGHSVKEFLSHYVMIVISILTALGMEHVANHLYSEHVAERYELQIDAELQSSRQTLAQSIEDEKRLIDIWTNLAQRGFVLSNDCNPANEASYRALLKDAIQHYADVAPSFPSSAWDSAVASGAFASMRPDKVRRYSDAYAAIRAYESSMSFFLEGGLSNISSLHVASAERKMDCETVARDLDWHLHLLKVLGNHLHGLQAGLSQ